MRWRNRSSTAINVTLQLLVIYRLIMTNLMERNGVIKLIFKIISS